MAVSGDEVVDMVALQPKLPAVTLLTDVGKPAAVAWGLTTPESEGYPPATFIIDRAGVIRYRKLGDAKGDWPLYTDVATALK